MQVGLRIHGFPLYLCAPKGRHQMAANTMEGKTKDILLDNIRSGAPISRFSNRRRISGLALQERASGELPPGRRAVALLRRRPGAGELQLRSRLRPRVRVFHRSGRHPRPHRKHQEPNLRPHRCRQYRERHY